MSDFANELWMIILSYCPSEEMKTLKIVCKRWNLVCSYLLNKLGFHSNEEHLDKMTVSRFAKLKRSMTIQIVGGNNTDLLISELLRSDGTIANLASRTHFHNVKINDVSIPVEITKFTSECNENLSNSSNAVMILCLENGLDVGLQKKIMKEIDPAHMTVMMVEHEQHLAFLPSFDSLKFTKFQIKEHDIGILKKCICHLVYSFACKVVIQENAERKKKTKIKQILSSIIHK
jgi:hypothetical protein